MYKERKVKQSLNIVKKHVRLSVYKFVCPKTFHKSARDAELSIFSVDVFFSLFLSINKKRTQQYKFEEKNPFNSEQCG